MTLEHAIDVVQFAYPQIYYACHTRHVRKRSSDARLSRRDAEMLVHVGREVPTTVGAIAEHMDLARSTVSEAISALERHGYVEKRAAGGRDRRHVGVVLTARGLDVVRSTSVLEPARLRGVLGRLSRRQLLTVTEGLATLAAACRKEARA